MLSQSHAALLQGHGEANGDPLGDADEVSVGELVSEAVGGGGVAVIGAFTLAV